MIRKQMPLRVLALMFALILMLPALIGCNTEKNPVSETTEETVPEKKEPYLFGEDIVVVSNVTDYDEANDRLQDDYLTKAFNTLGAGQHVSLFRGRSFLSSSCCKIIPRKMIGTRRFNPRFAIGEDALFMAAISNRMREIALSAPDAVYYRRLRPLSASRKKRTRGQILRNSLKLCGSYIRLGLSDILHYNHLLISSRIAAVLMWVVKG